MPRDVITLQLGNYANYVGAHYWNTQDELLGYAEREDWGSLTACIDPDVLYVLAEGRQGAVTYRPKVLMMDLSGSLGGVSLSKDRVTRTPGSTPATTRVDTWGGPVEVHHSAPVSKSMFVQQLEGQAAAWRGNEDECDRAALQERQQVALEAAAYELDRSMAGPAGSTRFWTDFLKAELHPRSAYTLPGSWHGVADFTGWGTGRATLGNEGREEAMDVVRFFAEQCDGLEGFQLFGEDLSGWGSLAADMLDELRQEYPGRQLLYFSIRPPQRLSTTDDGMSPSTLHQTQLMLNEGLAMSSIPDMVNLYVPVAPPLCCPTDVPLHYQRDVAYQTSALLAAALHGATLPYRLHAGTPSPLGEPLGSLSLQALTGLLTARGGANLTSLRLLLPAPHLPHDAQLGQAVQDVRLPHRNNAAGHVVSGPSAHLGGGTDSRGTAAATAMKDLEGMMSLTSGVTDCSSTCLAEVITLQGPRNIHGPCSTSAALQALDGLLLRKPRRCVQHRCVTPLPLPLPLTFPRVFTSTVSLHGDVGAPCTSGPGRDVATVPLLTKLVATSSFCGMATRLQKALGKASVSAAGRLMLEMWDVAPGELDEAREALRHLAGRYAVREDISDDDDGDNDDVSI